MSTFSIVFGRPVSAAAFAVLTQPGTFQVTALMSGNEISGGPHTFTGGYGPDRTTNFVGFSDIMFDAAGFVDPKEKARLERELGLDMPILTQYWHWISGLVQGDLGFAYVTEKPAAEEIAPRIPVTVKLAVLSLIFSVVFGVPLGVISAVRQNTPIDYVLRVLSLSGLSLPPSGWDC